MHNLELIQLKFIFQDGSTLEVKDKSFRDAVSFVIQTKVVFDNEPFKIEFSNTAKVLYFNKSVFYAYLADELTESELLELTQCEGLYRNKTKLLTNTNDEIDKGALWMLRNKILYLIDDEDLVQSPFEESLFNQV